MKYKSLLLEMFGESPKIRIIDFLLDFPMNDFTKTEIVDAVRMSKTTLYKNFEILEIYGIVKVSRKIAKAKLYRINLTHPIVKRIHEIEKDISFDLASKSMKGKVIEKMSMEKERVKVPVRL